MNKHSRWTMVAHDLFVLQGTWTAWYIGIFLLINVVVHFFTAHLIGHNSNFLTISLQSARVYMLIIGIITAAEGTKTFVKMGITRGEYFKGNILSTILLGFLLVVSGVLIHAALGLILPGYDIAGYLSVDVLTEGFLQIIQFYLVGWMIILGFQRFTVLGGIVIIILNSGYMGLYQSLWNTEGILSDVNLFLYAVNIDILNLSFGQAAILSVVFTALTLWVINQLIMKLEIHA